MANVEHFYLLVVGFLFLFKGLTCEDCDKRYHGHGSFTCVCTDGNCPTAGEISSPDPGMYKIIISSKDQHRFHVEEGTLRPSENNDKSAATINIDTRVKYQKILGFGTSFTDASGLNILRLRTNSQNNLFKQYFSTEGLDFNLARTPIGGSDFSVRAYSYDDMEDDVELEHFALQPEDLHYKIPLMKKANAVRTNPLKLIASPWSPPAWMKDNNKIYGSGRLKRNMWGTWTSYLIKYLQEYKHNEIDIWGLTTQNHPSLNEDDMKWNSCYWTPQDKNKWLVDFLGPELSKNGFQDVKVMIGDNPRVDLPWYPQEVLSTNEARDVVDGITVHWYQDDQTSPELLTATQEMFPDKFILYSEACEGFQAEEESVKLGDWGRAESYASSIIQALNHWAGGWIDWNMALDTIGGPNWAGNRVDSPIIIDGSKREYLKQPMFYAMGHFSKFVKEGSMRIKHWIGVDQCDSNNQCEDQDLKTPTISKKADSFTIPVSTFLDPEQKSVIVVLLNKSNKDEDITIKDIGTGKVINIKSYKKSLTTILYNSSNT